MKRIDLRIDVGEAVGLERGLETAVSLFVPERIASPPIVVFAFPGGGYGRGYFHLDLPGYSQAEHHAGCGFVFVACDHLGVGDSGAPEPENLTLELLAAANHATVEAVMQRLASGSLAPGLAPVRGATKIGIGQSMGGCLLTFAQGNHASFDAVALLGWSGLRTVLPEPRGAGARLAETAAGEGRFTAVGPEIGRALFRYGFHWEDVPEEIVEQDMAGYPSRSEVPAWGSATIPPCAATLLTPGIVALEAAAIRVPVFIGSGERDVLPEPHAEPSAYAGSSDVTLVIVPKMAHMHNFAGTRATLWNRLADWMRSVAARRAE
jgi:alpha-beta hydrolase superfamily lysophospholipase